MSLLILMVVVCTSVNGQDNFPKKFKLPPALSEVSGLVIATPDSLWWHNDSGNAPELWLTNAHGQTLHTITLPTRNIDWEDLCTDHNNTLFIGDFGDNRRQRSNQRIYTWHTSQNRLDSLLFRFPDGVFHDVEAFFWHRDTLHLFTKSRIQRGLLPTYHYTVPAQPNPAPHIAQLQDSLFLRKRVVTAAAIHPASGQVALLAYYYKRRLGFLPYSAANIFVLTGGEHKPLSSRPVRSKRVSCLLATQYESLDFWDAHHLIIASEKTVFIPAKAKRVRVRG